MSEKIQLSGVPKTLLLPLWGRAEVTRLPNAFLKDPRALELEETLDYDFQALGRNVGNYLAPIFSVRAYQLDKRIRAYLNRRPSGTVVNLGAGLDTTFERMDNGTVHWVDLDLPEVMQLRSQYIGSHERCRQIPKSILDPSWMEELPKGEELFFIAGGLFMYLRPEEVKKVLTSMAERFPGSEIIFDAISPFVLWRTNQFVRDADMPGAVMHWGCRDAKSLEDWSPKIRLVEQVPFFSGVKTLCPFHWLFFPMTVCNDLLRASTFIHLKFKDIKD